MMSLNGRRLQLRSSKGLKYCQNAFQTSHKVLKVELEDLKVLKRSPDLLNNVKIGQGQLAYQSNIFCFTIYGQWPF